MGLLEKIKEIEFEMSRTQKNKRTEYHLGLLKAKLARYRSQLLEPPKKPSPENVGFSVIKHGQARVAMIGFPSVGKSTILNAFTKTYSEINERDFTTLTCIPGILYYNCCEIQLLDLPGIIEGASEGKGKGRQVIGVAKSADLILIILDANKNDEQKEIILNELDKVGIRINKEKPHINVKKTAGGGVQLLSRCKLTNVDQDLVRTICKEYKINNAQIKFDDDYTIDDLIDTLEGNRCYVKGLFVYNKIDTTSIEEVDKLAHLPDSVVLAANCGMGNDYFLEKLWDYLGLVRIYTKKKNEQPDFEKPVVLRKNKGGFTVRAALGMIHRELVNDFKEAIVWGKSVKYSPQKVGLNHILEDEDVLQILKKSGK